MMMLPTFVRYDKCTILILGVNDMGNGWYGVYGNSLTLFTTVL